MSEADKRVAAMCSALRDVLEERKAQDAKWGEQNHDPLGWLGILIEEVGEYAQAYLKYGISIPEHNIEGGGCRVRKEAVQVAAVALAIVECCDRNDWVREDADD